MEEGKKKKKKNKLVDLALMSELGISKNELKSLKKKLAKAEGRPDRGIETWFRLASKNLYSRLQIVDTKSNILITANAIIISVVLGSLFSELKNDPHLIFGIIVLILTNLISISFAIVATMPQAWNANVNAKGEVKDLMTFDDFHTMSLEEYNSSVLQMMENGNTLYPSIITDIYELGVALARKYKLIRWAYQVFLVGIISSIVVFVLGHYLVPNEWLLEHH